MIYLEANMPPYVGYDISDVSRYISKGRPSLLAGKKVVSKIQQLIKFLEVADQNNLSDSMQLALCPVEVIHLQNLHLMGENDTIIQLDTEEISKRIDIIDNISLPNIRVIVLNGIDIYGGYHFSLLKHKETIFDNEVRDYLTIFIDRTFLEKKNDHNKLILKLIFSCMDFFISDQSHVNYNIYSEHPIVIENVPISFNTFPRTIFRNRLSTNEILYISEYFVFLFYYLRKWFVIKIEEMKSMLQEFPIYEYMGEENVEKMLGIICDSIDDHLNEDGELEKVLNCEYEVAIVIRDAIMNKVYED